MCNSSLLLELSLWSVKNLYILSRRKCQWLFIMGVIPTKQTNSNDYLCIPHSLAVFEVKGSPGTEGQSQLGYHEFQLYDLHACKCNNVNQLMISKKIATFIQLFAYQIYIYGGERMCFWKLYANCYVCVHVNIYACVSVYVYISWVTSLVQFMSSMILMHYSQLKRQ